MTFYFQKILDKGTLNPIVARTHVQWGALLKPCQLDNDRKKDALKKEDLNSIFLNVMKAILAAKNIAVPLIQELQNIDNNPHEHGLIWDAHTKAIPAAHKLDEIKIFVKHANECVKLLAQALSILFDKGWTEAKFEPILRSVKELQEQAHEDWQIVEVITNNIAWLNEITELRNLDEHKFYKRQKNTPLFTNYTLLSTGEIMRPQLCNGQNVLTFLIESSERLFLFSELLIVTAIELLLPAPIIIEEIPTEMRRQECPMRFKLGLGHSYITNQGKPTAPASITEDPE